MSLSCPWSKRRSLFFGERRRKNVKFLAGKSDKQKRNGKLNVDSYKIKADGLVYERKKIVMVSLWVSLLKKTWVAVGNMKLVKRKKERKKKTFFVILNFGWNLMDYSQLQLDPSKLQFLNRYLTTTIDESSLSDKTDQLVSFRICSLHSSKTVFRCHRSISIVIPFRPIRLKDF